MKFFFFFHDKIFMTKYLVIKKKSCHEEKKLLTIFTELIQFVFIVTKTTRTKKCAI